MGAKRYVYKFWLTEEEAEQVLRARVIRQRQEQGYLPLQEPVEVGTLHASRAGLARAALLSVLTKFKRKKAK